MKWLVKSYSQSSGNFPVVRERLANGEAMLLAVAKQVCRQDRHQVC